LSSEQFFGIFAKFLVVELWGAVFAGAVGLDGDVEEKEV